MSNQIISAYFEDDCADELTLDPVFNAVLDIDKCLRDVIYSIKHPEHMLLDLDSTLFGTYGEQERGAYFAKKGMFGNR